MRLWARRRAMTCQELVELVTEYLEGTLPAADRKRFDRHISACPHCTAYLAQMQITIRALGRLEEDSIPAQAREAMLAAFREWKRGEG
jgi:anti-sigma factor RsiW